MRLASRFGRYNSIRRERPLTDDELMQFVPSVFSGDKHESRSERYTYIPTINIINKLRDEGFQPFFACQSRVRDLGRREYSKHMLRLRREGNINGKEVPEIILLNSHDGSSSYQMSPGIFRFVCTNGLVCGNNFGEIRVPHKGDIVGQVIEGAYEVLGVFDKVTDNMEAMKEIHLNSDEQHLFGRAALMVRYEDENKTPVTPEIDWSDDDAHQASSGSRASYDARHDIDAKASKDFKEASDYFTSRKVSESGSHTDNNADSRVDQLSAALNSAKQSYDQYTTNMTRSHEYAEMASRTESMSGQMSEDLSQQFAQYVMKHAPQDAEAILTNTSSPEIAERRRAMAWSFVQEQIQPGVDNAWRESRGDIGKGMESVPSGGGSQDIIADHQGHQAIIEQRTQDSNIRNDVKHQVDNMVTEYKGNIGDTQNSIRGEENIVRGQYSELQNHHKTEALSQNNKYNEEKSAQERMPGADSPQELMKRAKEYQDKYKQ